MVVSDIQLYEILSLKLGKEEAKALAQFVETKVEQELTAKAAFLATKDDITAVRKDMHELEVRLTRNIYIVGVIQFLAIVGSVLTLLKFHVS